MKHLTQEQTDALLHDDTEPKFKPWQPVIARDLDKSKWTPDFFIETYVSNGETIYRCFRHAWRQCLPAKGNRHLIGTTDSPTPLEPESEFKFGDKVEVLDVGDGWKKGIFIQSIAGRDGLLYNTVRFDDDSFELFTCGRIRRADW